MIDAQQLRSALERAGVTLNEADVSFVLERERLRPPTPHPARRSEPALLFETRRLRRR